MRPHLSTNGACLRPDQRFGIGARVDTTDGHVGNLTRVVIDPVAQALTHLAMHMLLQPGHLWGRKQVAIPIGSTARIDDEIRVARTKEQVQGLPAAPLNSRP